MKYCCDKFSKKVQIYDPSESSISGSFEQDSSGEWNINGCCGSCYVVKNMKYCPFCGTELKVHKEKLIVNVVLSNPVFQSPEMQKKAMDEIVNKVIENYKNNGKIRQAMKGDG